MTKRINLLKVIVVLATLGFFIIGGIFTLVVAHGHADVMWRNAVYLSLVMVYLIDILVLSTGIILFQLLTLIDKDELVTDNALAKLSRITKNLLFIAIFSVGFLPMFYQFVQEADAPGVMGIGFLIFGIALTIFSISWVLEGLLKKALKQKV